MVKKPTTPEFVVSEEDKVGRAALVLASWEDEILEPSTSDKLHKMKTKTLSECESRQGSNVQNKPGSQPIVPLGLPEHGYSFDGTRLPCYPPLQALKGRIGVISPPFQKQLTNSDVGDGQGRLSLNNSFVNLHYLPMLNRDEDLNLRNGIRVTIYGPESPDGVDFNMDFKFWGEKKSYVLNGGWTKFCKHYKLEACTYWVTIWMFRDNQTNRLCFALDWVNNPATKVLVSRSSKQLRIGK